jgi:dihydrofolate reductase
MKNFKIIAIAAVSVDGVIGIGDKIPWHISEDFKHFRDTTMGSTLIIGYNTYLTLPEKAFEGRNYFVLNGGVKFEHNRRNVFQFDSLDSLIAALPDNADLFKNNVYVAGGAMVYESAIDYCDEAIITWVNKIYPDGTKYFPIEKLFNNFEIYDDQDWQKSQSGLSYKITKYKK